MSDAPPPQPPRLRSLGGQPASLDLQEDLASIAELRASARENLWEVLGPSLADPLPEGLNELAKAFCAEHAEHEGTVARIVRGARRLLRGAATLGLDAEAFDRDLEALLGPGSVASTVLRAGFVAARGVLVREAVHKSLSEHGTLLTGMDWRLDSIVASQHGAALNAPVLTLTLRVQRAGASDRITLQATPETLVEIRGQLERLLRGLQP